jgi:hypothetical protein
MRRREENNKNVFSQRAELNFRVDFCTFMGSRGVFEYFRDSTRLAIFMSGRSNASKI